MDSRSVNRLLVMGTGCRLMRDDGIGSMLADKLFEALYAIGIEVIAVDTDVSFGLMTIEPDDYVIILDAVITGNRPGSVMVAAFNDIHVDECVFSMHETSLLRALMREQACNGCLIGIEAAVIAPGLELSPALQDEFDGIATKVYEKISDIQEKFSMGRI